MKTKLVLVSLLLILISINIVKSFKCGTDQLKLKPKHIESTEEEERRRLDSGYQPIKIAADYSSLQRPSSMTLNIFEKIRDLIEETFDEFKKFLMIQHVSIDLSRYLNMIKEVCEIQRVGSDYANFLIDNDVIIFPQFDSTLGTQTIAAAAFCLNYGSRNRPVAGVLYINPSLSFNNENLDIYMKNVLLHEITHILIFSPTLFKYLDMVTTTSSGYFITSPKTVLKARQHFNCASIPGVPLENQGGESSMGSHWESRYMLGDYMISTDYDDIVLSDISLALFEDSGFYKVNYYSGGLFKFGKNKGCDFFSKKCINNGEILSEEFCAQPKQPMCTATRTIKAYCRIYDYSTASTAIRIPSEYQYFDSPYYGGFLPANFCPVALQDYSETNYYPGSCKFGISNLASDYGEKIGDTSFCFISSLIPSSSSYNIISRPICYEVQCDSNNKEIIVNIGSTKIICPTSGGTINNPSGFKGSIICPKYIDICDFKDNILCNEMFDCLSRKVEADEDSYMFNQNDEDFINIKPNSLINIGENLKINYFIFLLLFLVYAL